ncbi:MAG TPA: MFS transporter, partial [Arenibacter sp.]|nr:MFS transporter [Arenibacter sp.]
MKMGLEKTNKKALFALAMGGFGIGMTEFVIMGILPDVAHSLQISIPQAGHFISAYALGVVVGAPTLTVLSGRWPAHKVLLYLMLWFTVFNTLSAFSKSYEILLLTRFLSGLPHGAFFGIGAVVAGKLAKKGKAAQAIATMFAGLTVANVIRVALGTYLGQHYSWSLSFLTVG